ncbi:MAG: ribonuclease HI family protein [Sorangiineae bacterium]|nr:ribonuclease HI family protein [Polyangiaceae bacterium]MEB2322404.1 ribonuclease HI family protein [Sorangiineae bacterium]
MKTSVGYVKVIERLLARADLDDEERAVLEETARLFAERNGEDSTDEGRAASSRAPRSQRARPAARGDVVAAILWSDGAARGNPGPAGIGAVLEDRQGRRLAEHSEYLGTTTNNVAEYRALLAGLGRAEALGVRELEVRADSELMIRQLKGEYRVKNAGLRPLYDEAQRLLASFDSVRLVHVPRADNAEADRLANLGIDAR